MKKHMTTLQFCLLNLVLLVGIVTSVHAAELSKPVILVATDRLAGSPYEETVLLAVPSGDGQHLGLIINRPMTISLAAVFPDAASSRKTTEPVFFGGPVMSGALFAAIRATDPPSNYSVPLMPGLFLVTDEGTVGRLVNAASAAVRYFTGFIVWDHNELADEIAHGMWDIQFADANVLFRSNPQQLWLDLARARGKIAAN